MAEEVFKINPKVPVVVLGAPGIFKSTEFNGKLSELRKKGPIEHVNTGVVKDSPNQAYKIIAFISRQKPLSSPPDL